MIDKIMLKFCGWIDSLSDKVVEVLTFDFPNCKTKDCPKKKTKNVKSPDNRMDFPND